MYRGDYIAHEHRRSSPVEFMYGGRAHARLGAMQDDCDEYGARPRGAGDVVTWSEPMDSTTFFPTAPEVERLIADATGPR